MAQEHVSVLIVGAGGAGLSLTLLLRHHGIAPLLVERRSDVSWFPRARNLNCRTLEVFRGLGLEAKVLAAGGHVSQTWRKQTLISSQRTVHADGYSGRLYGHGGLKPTFVSHQRGFGHNPDCMVHYRGADVREALDGLRREKGDPHEGIQLQFVNPVTGGPVGSTMDYAAQLLRPGEETLPKRETSSTFMVVMDGEGYTEVGGQRFTWQRNDIVVIPNFLWRHHANTGRKGAVIYTTSDAALMRNIGQYRAQGKVKDGSVVQLVP